MHESAAGAETLVLVLGDQLTPSLPALAGAERRTAVVLMAEVADEATYVRHHRKKLAFVFAAMRHYAEELRAAGWRVDYVTLEDSTNTGSLGGELTRAVRRWNARRVRATEAGEWRVRAMQREWQSRLGVQVDVLPDTRFVCREADFADWAGQRTQLRMEYFYRRMRRATGLLMEGDAPAGGRWNFDAENRAPAARGARFAPPPRFAPDAITRAVLAMVARRFPDHPGALEPFHLAVTRADAERALEAFLHERLPGFGATQDAMLAGEPVLNHSLLSPYLNVGLLDPLTVCRRAEAEYRAGRAPLAAVEGFVRQILGWREYVRGIYFQQGPDYGTRNALGAQRALPAFYWTADTRMACVQAVVAQTLESAYAHHIQRLMVTGNFALLAGVAPREVHEWYLAVYADAFEWVELPNTLGMSQYADGGLLASKPYAASGAYIKRMSDYCTRCRYDVRDRRGANACPFNALYWDFLARNAPKLQANPRLANAYRQWRAFAAADQRALRARAAALIERADSL